MIHQVGVVTTYIENLGKKHRFVSPVIIYFLCEPRKSDKILKKYLKAIESYVHETHLCVVLNIVI